ncbi:MAG: ABC transporter substrate-binding protein [Xanthobacteraceae bacterium]
MRYLLRFAAIGALLLTSGNAFAEANQVRFARQLGLGYLQFYVMQDKQMLEKAAERAGLGKVTATYSGMGTPTAITDALLSSNVDVVGIGLPAFLTMWDKTRGNMDVRGVVAMNRQPAYLTTRNPSIKSIRDFTDSDRIALPAPKVSVQAIMLQMIAEKALGKFDAIDKLTVGMSHPDGTAAMLSGKLEITAHFTSAPFQYQQLENPVIRKVLSSYDATDGPNTFSVIATISRWREANPKLYRATYEAILEANEFIAKNPREAAEIFVRIENTKLPVEFIQKMISDPEFSYAPEPENVMKIYSFMNKVGALKNMPATWQDLFFPEVHALKGN